MAYSLHRKQSVGIIGAGLSGIAAAIRLQEKGYRVQLFEREAQVGGKCLTHDLLHGDQVYPIDMGATVVALSFQKVLSLAKEVDAPMSIPNPYKIIDKNGQISSLRDHYWQGGRKLDLIHQFLSYLFQVRSFHKNYVTKTGYRTKIPHLYRLPFAQYCHERGLSDILPWFDLPVAAWGYKTPEELPTWYVMGEVNVLGLIGLFMTILKGKSQFVKTFSHGYGQLAAELASHYDLDIQLNDAVTAIRREPDGVEIESRSGKSYFDFVILSNPQLVSILADPSPAERTFFDDLQFAPYANVLCRLGQPIDAKLLVEQNLRQRSKIRMIAAPHENVPLVVCYLSIEKDSDAYSVEAIVERDLALLGIELEEIHKIRIWKNYFPHFSSFNGYEALLAAQGENRTLYVGAINQFEFTEASVSTALQLVDKHFPDLQFRSTNYFSWLYNLRYWFK